MEVVKLFIKFVLRFISVKRLSSVWRVVSLLVVSVVRAGEVQRSYCSLQTHLHRHAVAPDNQDRLRYHEPWRQPHKTGTVLNCTADTSSLCVVDHELNLFHLLTDGKRWDGWRVLTPHRQHRSPCRGQYDGWYPARLTFFLASYLQQWFYSSAVKRLQCIVSQEQDSADISKGFKNDIIYRLICRLISVLSSSQHFSSRAGHIVTWEWKNGCLG